MTQADGDGRETLTTRGASFVILIQQEKSEDVFALDMTSQEIKYMLDLFAKQFKGAQIEYLPDPIKGIKLNLKP